MNRHGILNNVAGWLFPVVILFFLIAGCSSKVLPNQNPIPPKQEEIHEIPHIEDKITTAPAEEVPTRQEEVTAKPGIDPDIPEEDPATTTPPPAPQETNTRPARTSGPAAEPVAGPEDPAPRPALNADDYKVVLDVTEKIQLHHTGSLKVWIGLESRVPEQQEGKARGEISVLAEEVGSFARITPYAPEFTFEPAEPQRMRIAPGGSSVIFALTPEKEGTYEIGAKIELFDNEECIGVGIPKTTENVSVMVVVNSKEVVKSHVGQLGTVVWDNFVRFWGAFVALVFAALLFVIRKFVHKKTGYSDGKDIPKE